MNFKNNEVLILLGAGASADAGFPTSVAITRNIEALLDTPDWQEFRRLYYYVKAAIHYADGIGGYFGADVAFNVERLVNALAEIEQKEQHPLFPFIGAWNSKLTELAQPDFSRVTRFRQLIVQTLKDKWMACSDYAGAAYYTNIARFQKEYNFSLRVFSLNYDLCLERHSDGLALQRGFDEGRNWDWRLFEEDREPMAPVYLYKLHGSVDWKRHDGRITYCDDVSTISIDELAIIFGTSYKLQYVDPFLFFAYELRKWTLAARLIVTIGYSFGDEHINGILAQALAADPARRVLAALWLEADSEEKRRAVESAKVGTLRTALKLADTNEQLVTRWMTGKDFMEKELKMDLLGGLFPPEAEVAPGL